MKLIRDYKGIAIIYLVITIINIIWITGYQKPVSKNVKVDDGKTIVMVNKHN